MVKIGRQKTRPNTLVSPAPVGWRTLAEKVYCKVINGESLAAQHRVLVMDQKKERRKKIKSEHETLRIKWHMLIEEILKKQIIEMVLDEEKPVQSVWERWEEQRRVILRVDRICWPYQQGGDPTEMKGHCAGMIRCRM